MLSLYEMHEYVNTMAEDLLAYVMYKFKIDTELAVVLQATILSLVSRLQPHVATLLFFLLVELI